MKTAALTASISGQGFCQSRRFIAPPENIRGALSHAGYGSCNGAANSAVVPAQAGTHNHRAWLLKQAGAPAFAIIESGGYGPRPSPGRQRLLGGSGDYNINRLKSAFLARSPTCFCTYSASTVMVSPWRSGAAKEISSI